MRFASVRKRVTRLIAFTGWQRWPAEAVALTGLAFAMHAGVLAWIYPGYYSPFWPHHHDFYIPAALAHSPISYFDFLAMPRPIGMFFFEVTGHLGIRSAIAVNLLLVMLNCAITAMILRRITALKLNAAFWTCFLLYLFLVFSHPYQYVWSTYDVFSQLSYFLLACAAMLCLRGVGISILFGFFVCAFLAKETFALSALFLCMAWWMLAKPRSRPRVMYVSAALGMALGIALVINRINKSPFLGNGAIAGSPYQIDFSIGSMFSEWIRYADEGMSLGAWLFVAVLAFALCLYRRVVGPKLSVLAWALPVAGALAWLPNSVIPNHHYPGYSWNGSYLIYGPALFLGTLWAIRQWAGMFAVAASCLAIATPALSAARYSVNEWVLEQQHRQQRLLSELAQRMHQLPSGEHSILVTGLDFPFSPFDYGYSLLSLGALDGKHFSVVTYASQGDTSAALEAARKQLPFVQFVTPKDAYRDHFDVIWMFRNDGSLIRSVQIGNGILPSAALGFTPTELMIFPGVAEALGVASGAGVNFANLDDGYRLLNCGTALISYQQPAMALRCLEASIRKIPANAYPYYYSGIALELLKQSDEAKLFFEKAVAHDDAMKPNPAFKEAMQRSSKRRGNNLPPVSH